MYSCCCMESAFPNGLGTPNANSDSRFGHWVRVGLEWQQLDCSMSCECWKMFANMLNANSTKYHNTNIRTSSYESATNSCFLSLSLFRFLPAAIHHKFSKLTILEDYQHGNRISIEIGLQFSSIKSVTRKMRLNKFVSAMAMDNIYNNAHYEP